MAMKIQFFACILSSKDGNGAFFVLRTLSKLPADPLVCHASTSLHGR